MLVPLLVALDFLDAQTVAGAAKEPLRAELRWEDSQSFRFTIFNQSRDSKAVCLYSEAYEVVFTDKGKRIGSLDRYINGGLKDGTLYHARNLRVPSSVDWMLLPPRASVSFLVGVYDVDGPVDRLPRSGTATVRFREDVAQGQVPDWLSGHPAYRAPFPDVKLGK